MNLRTFPSFTGYGRTIASRVFSHLIKKKIIEKKMLEYSLCAFESRKIIIKEGKLLAFMLPSVQYLTVFIYFYH